MKDDGYGNTPLHIGCSLHSFIIVKRLMQIDKGLMEEKNKDDKTPIDIMEEELKKYKEYVECPEKPRSLERLTVLKAMIE